MVKKRPVIPTLQPSVHKILPTGRTVAVNRKRSQLPATAGVQPISRHVRSANVSLSAGHGSAGLILIIAEPLVVPAPKEPVTQMDSAKTLAPKTVPVGTADLIRCAKKAVELVRTVPVTPKGNVTFVHRTVEPESVVPTLFAVKAVVSVTEAVLPMVSAIPPVHPNVAIEYAAMILCADKVVVSVRSGNVTPLGNVMQARIMCSRLTATFPPFLMLARSQT